MIKKLVIKNTNTYSDGVALPDPGKLNLIFGTNGAGKSTIANRISKLYHTNADEITSQQEKDDYNNAIEWENKKDENLLLFNEEFVHTRFDINSNNTNGVSLGESSETEINSANQEIIDLQSKIDFVKRKLFFPNNQDLKSLVTKVNDVCCNENVSKPIIDSL